MDLMYDHHHPWRKNRGKKTQTIQQRIQIQGSTRSHQGGQNHQPIGRRLQPAPHPNWQLEKAIIAGGQRGFHPPQQLGKA